MPLAVHYRYVMQHIFAFSPKILAEFRQIKDFSEQKVVIRLEQTV